MSKDYVLVSYSGNWADEMNISSIDVVEKSKVEHLDSTLIKWPFRFYFGTNEDGEIARGDIVVSDVPDGLDPEALLKLINDLNLNKQVSSMLDTATEKIYEGAKVEWTKAFRTAILALDDVALARMEASVLAAEAASKAHKEHKQAKDSCPNARKRWYGNKCECVRCDGFLSDAEELDDEFRKEWKAFMEEYKLDQIQYTDIVEPLLSSSFREAMKAFEEASSE